MKKIKKEKREKSNFKKAGEKIKKLTFGLVDNVLDTALLIAYSIPYMIKEPSMSRVMENIAIIWDGYDPDLLRRGFYNLKSKKYLDKNSKITQQGWEKIQSLLPVYKRPGSWNGQWHLVVFDVPERLRRKRDLLRDKLMALNFGMLQKSVWLSPFDYLEIIDKLVDFYKISPYVLSATISKVDNQEDKDLAGRVWPLGKISRSYRKFIAKYRKAEKTDFSAKLFYLSILKQDPQLPRELLPDDWSGEEAAKIARKKKFS